MISSANGVPLENMYTLLVLLQQRLAAPGFRLSLGMAATSALLDVTTPCFRYSARWQGLQMCVKIGIAQMNITFVQYESERFDLSSSALPL
jgi:hypothetical protein